MQLNKTLLNLTNAIKHFEWLQQNLNDVNIYYNRDKHGKCMWGGKTNSYEFLNFYKPALYESIREMTV